MRVFKIKSLTAMAVLLVWGCSSGLTPESNQSPNVQLTSPRENQVFLEGEAIEFVGSAADAEDGDLTGESLQWSSDLDGAIGAGNTFTSHGLSIGVHTISLTAMDSDGDQGTASRSGVTVNVPPIDMTGTWDFVGFIRASVNVDFFAEFFVVQNGSEAEGSFRGTSDLNNGGPEFWAGTFRFTVSDVGFEGTVNVTTPNPFGELAIWQVEADAFGDTQMGGMGISSIGQTLVSFTLTKQP